MAYTWFPHRLGKIGAIKQNSQGLGKVRKILLLNTSYFLTAYNKFLFSVLPLVICKLLKRSPTGPIKQCTCLFDQVLLDPKRK